MIQVSQTYDDAIENGGQYEWQIVNGNNIYTKDNLVRGTLSTAVFDRLSLGNTVAAELRLTLRNATGISASEPLLLQFRAVSPSLISTWYTKGEYFIDQMDTSVYSGITEIVAFDAMLKAETDFMPTGSWVPTDAWEIYDMICGDMGVLPHEDTEDYLDLVIGTVTIAPNVGVGGTTDRDMLTYFGIMGAGNWVITYDQTAHRSRLVLKLADVASANIADVGDAVSNFEAYDAETVKRVKLWLDHETYYLAPTGYTEEQWLALGGRCIEQELPLYASQAVANNIYSNLRNKTFYPYTAPKAYVDPKYEVWDGISVNVDNPVTSIIAMQTLNIDPLASSSLQFYGEEKINSLYPYVSTVERSTIYQIGQAQSTADAAEQAASDAATAAGNANYREQLIYISKASGTTSVNANTTWVTNTTGNQNTWTTKRPVYNSSYPVLFVATQRQSVTQSSGTTCTCTTPMIDQTTTVIDGGHITTGTIDCNNVNVTNIKAGNITTGTLTGITITGNTISGNTITGGTISGTTITGSELTSATANGSVRIKDGSIDFFKNATTTGTPFSRIKHVVDSTQGDSIEWTNSGYTKLVNTGGGQWTADFVQFALGASNPQMQMQIYSDSDGTHTKILSDYVDITGAIRCRIGTTTDYDRFVVGLCKSYSSSSDLDSWWSGRIIHDRPNGVIAPYFADVCFHNRYQSGTAWWHLRTDWRNYSTSKTDSSEGWRPCTFIYNGETYAGIEGQFTQSAAIWAFGSGNLKPFVIPYYDRNSGSVLNSEVYNSINFISASEFGGSRVDSSAAATVVTSGITISSQIWRVWNKYVQFTIAFYGTFPAGGTVEFTIPDRYKPPQDVHGCGYWSQSPLIARIFSGSTTMRVRNANANARTAPSNDPFVISVQYILS